MLKVVNDWQEDDGLQQHGCITQNIIESCHNTHVLVDNRTRWNFVVGFTETHGNSYKHVEWAKGMNV